MCTALSLSADDGLYFARTLDLEYRFSESVTLTPRRCPILFTDGRTCADHAALLGMAYVVNGYPLYYDAMNEHGLCMAGLSFAHGGGGYAVPDAQSVGNSIAPWELIPDLLTTCSTASQVRTRLSGKRMTDVPFTREIANQPMHWIVTDGKDTLVIEPDRDGYLRMFDNPANVLTNAPSFPEQYRALAAHESLTPHPKTVNGICLRGSGAIGLPGDWSSASRFVRAAFLRRYAEVQNTADAFALLDSVKVPRGVSLTEDGHEIVTVYSAVMEPRRMRYSYRCDGDTAVHSVTPTPLQLRGNTCVSHPL